MTQPSKSALAPNVQGDCSKVTSSGNQIAQKQGAYGKIKTHAESKISQLCHVDEVFCAVSLLYIKPLKSNLEDPFISNKFDHEDLAFCDEILGKVSWSFAAVIRQLPASLLVDVLVFYLVLRALDTIEDDMTAFETRAIKVKHLLNFHLSALTDPTWSMDGVGEGHERRLLQEFQKCHSVYASLEPTSREVISDIAHRMATGMSEFVNKDLGQGTVDVTQYNRYCYFVAGLVGEGLCRLFAQSGLEDPNLSKELRLSHQMGLFLQKTNILRDYLEDYVDGRAFWPQTIWKRYAKSGELGYFTLQSNPENKSRSLQCLNELITDALELVPDCLAFLSLLKNPKIFRFCAIPQVMAMATLEKLYHNADVFTGVVKIRKGLSCKLIMNTSNLNEVHATFEKFSSSIKNKAIKNRTKDDSNASKEDSSFERTLEACDKICDLSGSKSRRNFLPGSVIFLGLGFFVVAHLSKLAIRKE